MKTLLTTLFTLLVLFGYSQSTRQTNPISSTTISSTTVTIKGFDLVCSEQTNGTLAKYQVDSLLGLTDFIWSVPQGMMIQSGQGTHKILVSVDPTFVGGDVTLTTRNSYGIQVIGSFSVGLIPQRPTLKNPLQYIQFDEIITYSLSESNPNTNFVWTAPYGSVIMSGQGTSNVQIKFSQSFIGGEIEVFAGNECGESDPTQYYINTLSTRLLDVTTNKLDNQKSMDLSDIAFHDNLTFATFHDTIKNGDDYYFEVVVQNFSQIPTDSVYLKYSIEGFSITGIRVIKPLEPGEAYTLPVLTLPTSTLNGDQVLKLELNPEKLVAESDYDNNKLDVPFYVIPTVVSSVDFVQNSSEIYNFPNPVTSETRFYVNLGQDFSETQNITINVYDVKGQMVKTIESFDKIESSVFTTESWNVVDLSSGVYFYNVVAKNNRGGVKVIAPKSNIQIVK
jgi:hypothetical protein